MEEKFFLHQIKRTKGTIEKGIVVKDTFEGAKQSYHAYLGAYAYGQQADTDFVSVMISNCKGIVLMGETWTAPEVQNA
jgi:uncharacterized protein (DUF305 family)